MVDALTAYYRLQQPTEIFPGKDIKLLKNKDLHLETLSTKFNRMTAKRGLGKSLPMRIL